MPRRMRPAGKESLQDDQGVRPSFESAGDPLVTAEGGEGSAPSLEGSVERSASLSVFGAPPRPALVTITRPSPGRRFARAAKAAGLFWAVAAGCVFLPGLHFVLVPTFLVVGIAAGVRQLGAAEIVSRVRGACPRCGQEQDFTAGNRLAPTWSLDCPACHNRLTLVLDPGAAPAS